MAIYQLPQPTEKQTLLQKVVEVSFVATNLLDIVFLWIVQHQLLKAYVPW